MPTQHENEKQRIVSSKVTLIVSIWLKSDDVAAFEAFEGRIAKVQQRHGGRIARAVRIDGPPGGDLPFEVHVVEFESRDALAAYREDPEMRELAAERDAIIAKTVIAEGHDVGPY